MKNMFRNKKVEVVCFVDWNSQIHSLREIHRLREKDYEPTGREVLDYTLRKIQKCLKELPDTKFFEITMRAYCGWHKGYSQTPLRRDLAQISEEDIHEMGKYPNMPLKSLQFGDLASGALPSRIVKSTGSHFPATCRERDNNRLEEKMVDTALVSDLIYHASQEDTSWLIVIGEDIDLMPGVYTAERFLARSSRRIAYLRTIKDKYLNCTGLDTLNASEILQ